MRSLSGNIFYELLAGDLDYPAQIFLMGVFAFREYDPRKLRKMIRILKSIKYTLKKERLKVGLSYYKMSKLFIDFHLRKLLIYRNFLNDYSLIQGDASGKTLPKGSSSHFRVR